MVGDAGFGEEAMQLLVFPALVRLGGDNFMLKRHSTSFWNSTNLEKSLDLNFMG
jgi:hypothetical protein